MRLFADHDVYSKTVLFLKSDGHDIETAKEAGLAAAPDEEILKHCVRERRVLVTRDKDYGNLLFAQGLPCHGVILIRCGPALLDQAHLQLRDALRVREDLESLMIAVEANRYRVRRAR